MKNACILLLLLLNIAMGIVLLNRNKQLGKLQTLIVQQGSDLLVVNNNLERCYEVSVQINNNTVQSLLNAAGAGYELVDPKNTDALFMLIPPFPCDVCLENEIQNVTDFLSEKEMIVIAPEFRLRDLKVQLQKHRTIKFIPYDVESTDGLPGAGLETAIYFRTAGAVVYDIFIPDKSNKEYSNMYFNKLS